MERLTREVGGSSAGILGRMLTVMHEGRIIADGGYEECLQHPEVRKSYWQIDVEAEGAPHGTA